MYKNQDKLIEELISQNLLTRESGNDLKKRSLDEKKSPEEILVSGKVLSEDKIVEIKAKLLNVQVADLESKEISKKVLNLIPREVAENYEMIPFAKIGNELHVGLVNPQNFKAVEAVEFLAQKASLKVRYFIITPTSFKKALSRYRILGEEAKAALAGIDKNKEVSASEQRSLKEMEEVIKSAPVSKMVLVILRHAIDGKSSDIHIEPSMQDTKVRYRIDGMLRTTLVLPKYIHAAIVSRIKVLANLKLDESRKPQDGRIRLNIEGRDIDFRVSTLPLFEGEKVVLRILDTSAQVPTLENLGYHPEHIKIIKEAIKKPHGLTLLTGPTGSGKTTTLYTVLTMLNNDGVNIVTLEDPIEYYIPGVNQSQINAEIGYSFASGLRSILRQDPNIVMLGEIRDSETTELVVHASLTGHMILSTLHTNDSIGAIPRLMDLGAEPFLLSAIINLIIAQRLVRKICEDCRIEAVIPDVLMKEVRENLSKIPPRFLEGIDTVNLKFMKGEGCAHCGNLGYSGRTSIAEVIDVTPKIREIINNNGKISEIQAVLPDQDFINLTQNCLLKAMKGITTIDEVVRVTSL